MGEKSDYESGHGRLPTPIPHDAISGAWLQHIISRAIAGGSMKKYRSLCLVTD